MDLYPAIDLRRGAVVRLSRGKLDHETQYSTDPVSTAQSWANQGARWLHVVNLDGAFGDESANSANATAIRAIAQLSRASFRVQLGGGIRTMHDIRTWLNLGVSRVVLGSAAVRSPGILSEAVGEFGAGRIAVGIDALGGVREGRVRVQGWTQESDLSPLELAVRAYRAGVRTLIYTDIDRDGMQTGPDHIGSKMLAAESGCNVIISGGIGSLDHLRVCAGVAAGHQQPMDRGALIGAITGRAIYEGNFTVTEALDVLSTSTS